MAIHGAILKRFGDFTLMSRGARRNEASAAKVLGLAATLGTIAASDAGPHEGASIVLQSLGVEAIAKVSRKTHPPFERP